MLKQDLLLRRDLPRGIQPMRVRKTVAACVGVGVMVVLAGPAMAQYRQGAEMQTSWGVYVEGGTTLEGRSKSDVATVGVTYNFGPRREMWGGEVTTHGDFFVSNWRAQRQFSGAQTYTQIGAIANARYRFDAGASPWFMDLGIGLTLFDGYYETDSRRFSTQFQFTEVLALGRNFGASGVHEVSLRLQHVSNGGIREPNPGENLVKLRYAYRF
ncbi:acyloxyacyl hydrolase [Variovorax sp. dw_954]|uniref:acyloxyacyl hydrolase n=1 Tax=Variovorax sp. dw_954 TaxID=2720078 RepID=UPI001BD28418|nr:acyloxyacyl hydrolase [Variovorax sp. dw_954]